MRHGKKIHKIGRTASHRKATLQSMSAALIQHKRIETTLGKARALRIYVEPIINRAKDDSTASRREAFRHLQNKDAIKALYSDIAPAIGSRPGGYTRIVKLGQRGGDAAELAVIELVDFNDVKPEGAAGTKRKTRRSRAAGKATTAPTAAATPKAETKAAPAATPAVAEEAEPTAVADASETNAPEANAPEANAPEANAPEAPAADTQEATDAALPETAAEPSDPTGAAEPPPEAGTEDASGHRG